LQNAFGNDIAMKWWNAQIQSTINWGVAVGLGAQETNTARE